jgi:hypothetical protein
LTVFELKIVKEYYTSDMAKVRPAGHMRPAKLFLRPLKFVVKLTTKIAIFEENFDYLSQKITFLKNIFGASRDFQKSAEKFYKNFAPLYPLE